MSVEIITSALSFAGVVVTVIFGNRSHAKQLKEQTDLTLYRIKQLEEKQDKHNCLIERVFRIEQHESVIDERLKAVNDRIDGMKRENK